MMRLLSLLTDIVCEAGIAVPTRLSAYMLIASPTRLLVMSGLPKYGQPFPGVPGGLAYLANILYLPNTR